MGSRQPNLLEKILNRDNLNNAYKRVKANKGAPGVDGMTVEAALPWLKEHGKELTESIRQGKYKPDPVRRKEIPKPDGGVRKLGIPSVKDRIVQQAIAQVLTPIYEPLFMEGSYGYRPGRSGQDAIFKIRGYAEEGYEWAVLQDLSKYFDTLNHEKLLHLLRREIKDERVVQLSKRFLKSGVMDNGVVMKTEEGSPQGGPLSPLLANIYLNEFDWEYEKRGVPVAFIAPTQYLRDCLLDHPVLYRRYSQRPLLSIRFRDVYSPYRLRFIFLRSDLLFDFCSVLCEILFKGIYRHLIDARRTLVALDRMNSCFDVFVTENPVNQFHLLHLLLLVKLHEIFPPPFDLRGHTFPLAGSILGFGMSLPCLQRFALLRH